MTRECAWLVLMSIKPPQPPASSHVLLLRTRTNPNVYVVVGDNKKVMFIAYLKGEWTRGDGQERGGHRRSAFVSVCASQKQRKARALACVCAAEALRVWFLRFFCLFFTHATAHTPLLPEGAAGGKRVCITFPSSVTLSPSPCGVPRMTSCVLTISRLPFALLFCSIFFK
jgi:hypothetical protein